MSTIITLTIELPRDADRILEMLGTGDEYGEFEGVFTAHRRDEGESDEGES